MTMNTRKISHFEANLAELTSRPNELYLSLKFASLIDWCWIGDSLDTSRSLTHRWASFSECVGFFCSAEFTFLQVNGCR